VSVIFEENLSNTSCLYKVHGRIKPMTENQLLANSKQTEHTNNKPKQKTYRK